jgi:hypothetical protein
MVVIPTSISVRPIKVTTVPVTRGVMTRLASLTHWLIKIATADPARHKPKMIPSAV